MSTMLGMVPKRTPEDPAETMAEEDPVRLAEDEMRKETIDQCRKTLERLVRLVSPEGNPTRALRLIELTTQKYHELLTSLGTGASLLGRRAYTMPGNSFGNNEGVVYGESASTMSPITLGTDSGDVETQANRFLQQAMSTMNGASNVKEIESLTKSIEVAKRAELKEEETMLRNRLRTLLGIDGINTGFDEVPEEAT